MGLYGRVAQLGEHLLCKQGVAGSIPATSTNHLGFNKIAQGFVPHTTCYRGSGSGVEIPCDYLSEARSAQNHELVVPTKNSICQPSAKLAVLHARYVQDQTSLGT